MTSLFRPWAHDEKITPINDYPKEFVDNPREIEFQNVKDHFRKRMERRLNTKRGTSQHDVPAITPPPVLDIAQPCWEELTFKGCTELVDTALLQGLHPGILEEYARMLTEQQRQTTERNRKQRPKKFRCPHCQVGFSNNGQLKGHIRIHTGERPFKCEAEHCGKSFTRNEELTRHRRIHSGLRPFPCPECGKPFGRKDHLKKHVRTHYQQRYQLIPIYPSQYPQYYYGI